MINIRQLRTKWKDLNLSEMDDEFITLHLVYCLSDTSSQASLLNNCPKLKLKSCLNRWQSGKARMCLAMKSWKTAADNCLQRTLFTYNYKFLSFF